MWIRMAYDLVPKWGVWLIAITLIGFASWLSFKNVMKWREITVLEAELTEMRELEVEREKAIADTLTRLKEKDKEISDKLAKERVAFRRKIHNESKLWDSKIRSSKSLQDELNTPLSNELNGMLRERHSGKTDSTESSSRATDRVSGDGSL